MRRETQEAFPAPWVGSGVHLRCWAGTDKSVGAKAKRRKSEKKM